jgi:hypothetical protein
MRLQVPLPLRAELVKERSIQPDLNSIASVNVQIVGQDFLARCDSGIERQHVQVATIFDVPVLREVTAIHWR